MKHRHAASLALVGWYLILPPVLPNGSPNAKSPLSEWEQSGVFDRATDCSQARAELGQRAQRQLARVEQQLQSLPQSDKNRPLQEVAPGLAQEYAKVGTFALRSYFAQCIATDDPRLKEK